ncbi:hypothetical protein [Desulfonema magnum]|uniref:Uncharacterized protein n=1 Tax=Desulfonema magnum TaxID=45655 RepID=A0A975BX16_9BACT|nr:hypothetical protein [Desulfonema magnum]QTA92932.1 Uncharacterized protein dnm_090250 [Desulfonema magnum]
MRDRTDSDELFSMICEVFKTSQVWYITRQNYFGGTWLLAEK